MSSVSRVGIVVPLPNWLLISLLTFVSRHVFSVSAPSRWHHPSVIPQVFWVCEATTSQYLKSTADPDMRDMENISMQMISWLSLTVTIVRCVATFCYISV